MVDLAQLPPPEMAAQLGRPAGETGVAVGDYMSRLNAAQVRAAYQLLAPPAGAAILEVGFGNGKLIGDLLDMAPRLSYAGIDASETMVREARDNNAALIQHGRVSLQLAFVEKLPFADTTFDRVLSVNSIYFWPDQLAGLVEIRRVMRGDALLVLASMTPETSARSPVARAEYGFQVLDLEALEALVRQAGFADVRSSLYEEVAKRLDGTPYSRASYMLLAKP
jgi:SAM-dependent methyltransferase